MKTVIFVWTHKFNIDKFHLDKYNHYKEVHFHFGLGDLIRATIKLFALSKKMNFQFIVDTQLHPLGQFLKKIKHPFLDQVLHNKNNVEYVCYGAVEDYINSKSDNTTSYIFTNDFFEGEMTVEIRKFIKHVFRPTMPFQEFIDNKISTIPKPYNILHYRLNDNEFLNKKSDENFVEILKHVKKHSEPNDVFITDTQSFKKVVSKNVKVFSFNTKICHLGLSTDRSAIKDTLFEFFLITECSKIKTYCKIHKMSGFVKWVSQIYNIPVEVITKY